MTDRRRPPASSSRSSTPAAARRAADGRRRRLRAVVLVAALALLVLARVLAPTCQAGERFTTQTAPLPAGERVEVPRANLVVLDGDTFRVNGRTVRLLGCDTPETAGPYFDGDQEPWAGRATAFVSRQLREAQRIEVHVLRQRDMYGRLLGHVFVNGEPLAARLVKARLAVETVSQYGDNGFPEVAKQILVAAERAQQGGPLPFQHPGEWRRENRRP